MARTTTAWALMLLGCMGTVGGCGSPDGASGGGNGSTDTLPPQVLFVWPADGATAVELPTPPIRVSFNEDLDPSSLTSDTLYLVGPAGRVDATISYESNLSNSLSDGTLIRTPTASLAGSLAYGTRYTVNVSPGIKDLAGNSLSANFASSFTTEDLLRLYPSNDKLYTVSQNLYASAGGASYDSRIWFPDGTWTYELPGDLTGTRYGLHLWTGVRASGSSSALFKATIAVRAPTGEETVLAVFDNVTTRGAVTGTAAPYTGYALVTTAIDTGTDPVTHAGDILVLTITDLDSTTFMAAGDTYITVPHP